MKRFHVNVTVTDLDQSIDYYTTLFGEAPAVRKPDYAKWMLEDPRLNFAIGTGCGAPGIGHLGLQADSAEELAEIQGRLRAANQAGLEQPDATCCYAHSSKTWARDPDGVSWETFHTTGASTTYGDDLAPEEWVATRQSPRDQVPACCG